MKQMTRDSKGAKLGALLGARRKAKFRAAPRPRSSARALGLSRALGLQPS